MLYQDTDAEYIKSDRTLLTNDPRVLIAVFVLILVSAFVIDSVAGLAVVLSYIVLLHRLSGLPFKSLIKSAKNMTLFVVLIMAFNTLLIDGEPLLPSIPAASREGLATGVFHSARVVVLYLSVVVFVAAASPEDFARGFGALFRPFSADFARCVAFYGFVTIGFLPLFVEEVRRVRIAQGFRGGGIEGGILNKLGGVRLLMVPVFLSAVHRSAELAAVVELRNIRFTIQGLLVVESATQKDYAFAVVTVVILAAAWFIV